MSLRKKDFLFTDEDSPLLSRLGQETLRPIFIMGLHRSGTTFLYESLARLFPLAPLTAYHIVFYQRLLSRFEAGSQQLDQEMLNTYFAEQGHATRQIDEIGLSHETVEEYCWLLKRFSGSVHLNGRTAVRFEEMCRKLLYLQPQSTSVLLKNPWDTAEAAPILTLFPDSRFIYIARDPLRILNSQLRNAEIFASTNSPYLNLLVRGFPLGQLVLTVQRILYRLLGAKKFRQLMTRRLMRDMIRELKGYRTAVESLPAEVFLETTYEKLSTEPAPTLTAIGDFLGLDPALSPELIESRPRGGNLSPEVESVRDSFLRKLERQGLIRD